MAAKMPSRATLGYALLVLSIWLGWEVVKAPLATRAPPSLALRIAPASPEVLARAAELELQAERFENAADLADASLSWAPFNAKALRTRGFAEARAGDLTVANDMITLAGNWSLRDDPAHSWLVEHRLRSGDYGSAFAHSDTLARRRPELRPQIFNLLAAAASQDPRGATAVVQLLATNPPWRREFIDYLQALGAGDGLLANLAVSLQRTAQPLSDEELFSIYQGWLAERRPSAIKWVRSGIRRPATVNQLVNGDFTDTVSDTSNPFAWRIHVTAGMSVEVSATGDGSEGSAAHITYNGYLAERAISQTLMLPAGHYSLTYKTREGADSGDAFEVKLGCALGLPIDQTQRQSAELPTSNGWALVRTTFIVPTTSCDLQELAIFTRSADVRRTAMSSFDDFVINQEPRP